MAGQGAQKNKAHKAGRRAGKSAREKHRDSKNITARVGIKSVGGPQSKSDRLNAAKQIRDKKRAELLERRRASTAPIVVAVLPLTDDVDVERLWQGMVHAFEERHGENGTAPAAGGIDVDDLAPGNAAPGAAALVPTTLAVPERKRARFTLLPPLTDRSDLLAVIDTCRAAEAILFAVSGDERCEAIDREGVTMLEVVRALGLPSAAGLVQSGKTSNVGLKERSAAKKRGSEAIQTQLPGDRRVFLADTGADFKQVVRHLADSGSMVQHWRLERPQLMVTDAAHQISDTDPSQCTLMLTGYVRNMGLSANQLMHVPGAGDFQIQCIEGLPEPVPANTANASAACMDSEPVVLAAADASQQETLVRLNDPDPLDGEQTWPTEEELAEADATRTAVQMKKRRLPKGTSDYQAVWILDEDGEASDYEDEEVDDAIMAGDEDPWKGVKPADGDGGATEFDYDMHDDDDDDRGLMGPEDFDSDGEETMARLKALREAQDDDVKFPDEVETPLDRAARERFARYRGLKSFRTSPWDPREDLPVDYSKVFAFENFKRAHKRAKAAAAVVAKPGDVHGVAVGSYVGVRLVGVPLALADIILARVAAFNEGQAAPFSVWGLLQHECKLSVLNLSVRKASSYTEPIANKEELLMVAGPRAFTARPIYSSDEHGADKHKMEKFLHEGRSSMATVYAPISYPPQPILAFKISPTGQAVLAASGSLKSCDPDRVVLKKIVLSGYPVRTHKSKAVVRFMFHNPDDIRWFKPVELWTKQGRRGRIREPVGTHGSMKCIFDGPISQQDAVCMSLYKRVYPKWPLDLEFRQ